MVLMTKSQRMLDHVDCRNVFRWKTAVGSIRDLSVEGQTTRRKNQEIETRVCGRTKKVYVC